MMMMMMKGGTFLRHDVVSSNNVVSPSTCLSENRAVSKVENITAFSGLLQHTFDTCYNKLISAKFGLVLSYKTR